MLVAKNFDRLQKSPSVPIPKEVTFAAILIAAMSNRNRWYLTRQISAILQKSPTIT